MENNYFDIPYDPATARAFALGVYKVLLALNIFDGHSKMYDPLLIDGDVAHSYIFDLEDGGRHHPFDGDYAKLSRQIVTEAAELILEDFKQR